MAESFCSSECEERLLGRFWRRVAQGVAVNIFAWGFSSKGFCRAGGSDSRMAAGRSLVTVAGGLSSQLCSFLRRAARVSTQRNGCLPLQRALPWSKRARQRLLSHGRLALEATHYCFHNQGSSTMKADYTEA